MNFICRKDKTHMHSLKLDFREFSQLKLKWKKKGLFAILEPKTVSQKKLTSAGWTRLLQKKFEFSRRNSDGKKGKSKSFWEIKTGVEQNWYQPVEIKKVEFSQLDSKRVELNRLNSTFGKTKKGSQKNISSTVELEIDRVQPTELNLWKNIECSRPTSPFATDEFSRRKNMFCAKHRVHVTELDSWV